MMRDKYEKTVSLKHSERISEIVDLDTGEVRKPRDSHLPDGKTMIAGNYNKVYKEPLDKLLNLLDNNDKSILLKMISSLTYLTNEIIPIDDRKSFGVLSDFFGVSYKKTVSSLEKLHKLGVYKKGCDLPEDYTDNVIKHWIFNPYIACSGKLLDDKLLNLFKDWELP
jgi:hypothetical protein